MATSAAIILVFISSAFAAAPSQRIVGGSSTVVEEYPYMASLHYLHENIWHHTCGGSLVSTRTIMTAAHCFYHHNHPSRWRVRLGSSFKSSGGQMHQAAQLINHEDYDPISHDNDMAVIRLATPAILSKSVQIVRIPPPNFNIPDNQKITAIGWGDLESLGPAPEQLQHVDVYVVNQKICVNRYLYLTSIYDDWNIRVTDGMLCSGILDIGGKSQCQRDSGGPVVLKTNNGHVVVGIGSWQYGCALPSYPTVNVRTSYYYDWVIKNGFMTV